MSEEELRAIHEAVAKVERIGRQLAPHLDAALYEYGPELTAGAVMSWVADVIRERHKTQPDNWEFLEASIQGFRKAVKNNETSATVLTRRRGN